MLEVIGGGGFIVDVEWFLRDERGNVLVSFLGRGRDISGLPWWRHAVLCVGRYQGEWGREVWLMKLYREFSVEMISALRQ